MKLWATVMSSGGEQARLGMHMFKAHVIRRQVDGVSIDFYIESSLTSCCVLINARFLTAAALQTLCRCREILGKKTVVTKLFICRFNSRCQLKNRQRT